MVRAELTEPDTEQNGDRIIVKWQGGGTFTGPLGPHQPTGQRDSLRDCGFFHIIDE
jgi:hypothetical protein